MSTCINIRLSVIIQFILFHVTIVESLGLPIALHFFGSLSAPAQSRVQVAGFVKKK
jgi:hypothetical protein